ncbi:MAG: WG repeat-containing protein [Bacteroidota bacterium]|nr:WG repeat-containing protein [Bacteroidota bacterium]
MKKILTLLLVTVSAVTANAQTDAAMLKWLNGHSPAIDLSKSTLVGYNTGVKITGPINKLDFTKYGIEAVKSYSGSSGVKVALTRFYFTKATIENEMLSLFADGGISVFSLHIGDEAIRRKYKEVFTRFAYTRLNTNETDLPIYEIDKVDSKAVYPNDVDGWKKLIKGYDFNPTGKYNVPAGTYEGKIIFVVTKDSIIKDFKKDGNSPRGINEMMLVLITKMPKWIPAKKNGQSVSSFVTIKVNLVIPERTNSIEDKMWKLEAEKYIDKNCNIANYENGKPGYLGLKPLNLDDNSNTPPPLTKNDNDVKQPVVTKEKLAYVNPERKKLDVQTRALFMNIELFSEGLAAVAYGKAESSKKWGFIDNTGKLVIQPKYSYVGYFSGGLAPAELNDQHGYIDKTGAVKIPFTYRFASSFRDGLAKVWNGDNVGFINHSGEAVIELKYDEANEYFNEGVVGVKKEGKWGFIDTDGKLVVPMKYDYVSSFYDGLARVILNKKYGFINKKGQEVIPLKYDGTFTFSGGLARVELKREVGFIDKSGNEVIPIKYEYTGLSFENGSVVIQVNKLHGLIDLKGYLITPIKYDVIDNFSEGHAQFWLNNKRGFINHDGQEVIPAKYVIAGKFSEGLVRVYMNGKWGYINKEDKIIISFKYDDAKDFIGGLAEVAIKDQKFIINKAGQKVIPKLQ